MADPAIALKVFSVLGETSPEFQSEKFRFSVVRGWLSPSFSPLVLLPGYSLESSDLDYVERFFQQHPITNPYLNQAPYFNVFVEDDFSNVTTVESVCAAKGWVVDKDPLSIDFLHEPMPLKLPENVQITLVDAKRSGLSEQYKEIIRRNFHPEDDYVEAVARVYREAAANSYTVMISQTDGTAMAGGTVSVRDGVGFLTWGAVNSEHRNRGLHRLLLSACTSAARSHGVDTCALTTRNKLIRGKWHAVSEMFICRKAG